MAGVRRGREPLAPATERWKAAAAVAAPLAVMLGERAPARASGAQPSVGVRIEVETQIASVEMPLEVVPLEALAREARVETFPAGALTVTVALVELDARRQVASPIGMLRTEAVVADLTVAMPDATGVAVARAARWWADRRLARGPREMQDAAPTVQAHDGHLAARWTRGLSLICRALEVERRGCCSQVAARSGRAAQGFGSPIDRWFPTFTRLM